MYQNRQKTYRKRALARIWIFRKSPKRRKSPRNTKLMPTFIVGFTCIGDLAFGDATENVRVQSTISFSVYSSNLWTENQNYCNN